ncbi:hypothetical protein G5B30_07765 [Sphingobacterium sp. SGG-5]|uniref:YdeI/OmpD-associated family protein n=1 Tax=Sphingobacterium sp. SGG-5 TaxID=2710881 RepID=UPI0013ED1777|nr:DUF1801 domain-containing protein [Sphingobacterium sp. SGG-5]NGM61810.1 hypothetical protein [Sphingobacterium sp. SGG-5]
MNEQVDRFFEHAQKWKGEMTLLREIVLKNKLLVEEYKWMHPCYTFKEKNIVLIHGFKEYCALLFHKGALLKDPESILIQQTENVQSARQLRFTNTEQIKTLMPTIKSYIEEAIDIEKSGAKVVIKKVAEYPIPEEFQRALDEDHTLQQAFSQLTPGRQKAYLFYFNQAKQSTTREARIEKYYQHILDGKGMND